MLTVLLTVCRKPLLVFTFVHPALLSGVLYQIQTVVDEILGVLRHSDVNLSV